MSNKIYFAAGGKQMDGHRLGHPFLFLSIFFYVTADFEDLTKIDFVIIHF